MATFNRQASAASVRGADRVSSLNTSTTSTAAERDDRGSRRIDHEVWFRVSGEPAPCRGVLSLAEGDHVNWFGRECNFKETT
jgi:hypothetical protein